MTDTPKRHWYAFRLRTLLVVVVVLGCVLTPLAIKVKKAHDQKRAVEWVLENSGEIQFDWKTDDGSGELPGPEWLRGIVGDDFFQAVHSVGLAGDQISDISPLRRLTDLQHLAITQTQVADLSPLRKMANLRKLWVRSSLVSDLAPLKGLTRLQELYLMWTAPVTDVSPLRGLIHLRTLDLIGTNVSDLTPLWGLTNLQELYLGATNVTDVEVARLRKALPNCKIIR